MEKDLITEKLAHIFKSIFNDENVTITDDLSANDVDGWDSLTHMVLINEVEKAFNITFKLKELNKMKNVGDMINIIISKAE